MGKHSVPHAQTQRRDEIRQLKQSGMTYREISKLIGVSYQRVHQLVAPTPKERIRIIENHGYSCDRCKQKYHELDRLEIHHVDYGENPELEVLCRKCHVDADKEAGTREFGRHIGYIEKTYRESHKLRNKNNTSGYRGVYYNKSAKKWMAKIRCSGKDIFGGYFSKPDDAARKYDELAIKYRGNRAMLNFPEKAVVNG